MKIGLFCLIYAISLSLIDSSKVLSSYGCYTLLGKLPQIHTIPRSINPIVVQEHNAEDLNIVCISLVMGVEFKNTQQAGSTIDLTSNAHGISLVLPKTETLSGLYGSSLEPVIVSSCKKARVIITSSSNSKLALLQPFAVFSCLEVIKQRISIPLTVHDESKDYTPQIDYSSLGSEVPFSKRPYECRFDSPTFAKEGSSINYKKKQVYWTCFSKVNQLLVINLFSNTDIIVKTVLSIVDDMQSSSNKISVKSPCNGTMHEHKQGILTVNQVFLRIECEEENLPNLLSSQAILQMHNQLRKK
ncbi:putative signal peptide-containing protein [Cryptosporidium canis]|uniref:Signal peptide-containing protein n=1 Tax=Cryptosporidium canis TaxID=195482 RepID=A0ABQ8P5U9_9CRYT|nr:putative signal peptide-containing protein [Cryptosporidium canis]KAJ1613455.1 putative signal peptide-containing protein [Cryptosporidium canis]